MLPLGQKMPTVANCLPNESTRSNRISQGEVILGLQYMNALKEPKVFTMPSTTKGGLSCHGRSCAIVLSRWQQLKEPWVHLMCTPEEEDDEEEAEENHQEVARKAKRLHRGH
eukprot:TRINITY_DN19236_c0_g1_i1.p1 TRINITY_DN19236_c0_g1~~TRINITY_DN19236_c0_g1_i1.p1  ORF type:complete len:112 (+),score=17.49 TRINITY_DN19236_c0_g1_i1:339-674(+)